MKKQVIFTADDLGIDSPVNRGIAEAFQKGLLTAASLLMNAPCTQEGIALALKNPELETGLHLAVVEGISLREKESTVTDPTRYFGERICLIRDWKMLVRKYLTGKLNYHELREELELQILAFKAHFQSIPFLNGTQHMHLLPRIWKIVILLCKKYDIGAVRLPGLQIGSFSGINQKTPLMLPFRFFGQLARKALPQAGMKCPDNVAGMPFSGKISEDRLLAILRHLPHGKTEIVMHPGYESVYLRRNLPWGYANFDWEGERTALTSPRVKTYLEDNLIETIRFSNL